MKNCVAVLIVLIASSSCCAQMAWGNPNGQGGWFSWSGGQSFSGLLGDPSAANDRLIFTPLGFVAIGSVPNQNYSVSECSSYLSAAAFGGSGGASIAISGSCVIPPQGGRFRASVTLSATDYSPSPPHPDCGYSAAAHAEVIITEPGEHDWQLYVPAHYYPSPCPQVGPVMGVAKCVLIEVRSNAENESGSGVTSGVLLSLESSGEFTCPADFDGSGSLGVPDIFEFLSRWFVQDQAADFNNSGGLPDVPDIFSYLAAWFAGCP